MKKHLVRLVAITLVLAAALSLCACMEIPPERVSYLPAEKTLHYTKYDYVFDNTATYKWSENSCVVTVPDFIYNVSIGPDGPSGYTTEDLQLVFTYDADNSACRIEYRQGEGEVCYDLTLDADGRVSRIKAYDNYDPDSVRVLLVSYPDAYTVSIETEGGEPGYDEGSGLACTATIDRETRNGTLVNSKKPEAPTAIKYDRDGNYFIVRDDLEAEYATNGDIKKFTYGGSGFTDTEFSIYCYTARWQHLAALFTDELLFGFTASGWNPGDGFNYFAAFCVSSFVI